MFYTTIKLSSLQQMCKGSMVDHLGIIFTEIGESHLSAKMPVDSRTHQPFGMLHGGASVALAETLGSVAANLTIDQQKYYCVGLEINANHVKSVRDGWVYGTTTPLYIGTKTQIWEIRISNVEQELICISRLTLAVLEK